MEQVAAVEAEEAAASQLQCLQEEAVAEVATEEARVEEVMVVLPVLEAPAGMAAAVAELDRVR